MFLTGKEVSAIMLSKLEGAYMAHFKGPNIPVIIKVALGFVALFLFGGTIYISVLKLQNHSPQIEWALIMFLIGVVIIQITFAGRTWAEDVRRVLDRLRHRR